MTLSECERVGKHMRKVWDDEAALAKAPEGAENERAKLVIKGEGDRMQDQWLAECKREIEGRTVDEKEVSCILAAKSITEIQNCAERK